MLHPTPFLLWPHAWGHGVLHPPNRRFCVALAWGLPGGCRGVLVLHQPPTAVLATTQGDKYTDRVRYKDTQAEKKKGFLTSDFSKRDEFSNTVRTEQYREQLRVRGRRRRAHACTVALFGVAAPRLAWAAHACAQWCDCRAGRRYQSRP